MKKFFFMCILILSIGMTAQTVDDQKSVDTELTSVDDLQQLTSVDGVKTVVNNQISDVKQIITNDIKAVVLQEVNTIRQLVLNEYKNNSTNIISNTSKQLKSTKQSMMEEYYPPLSNWFRNTVSSN